ncbi:MAG: FtsX-like permease family protein [Coriobacteriaceae bacterium]|nr:FtsX-like permease family protein [Coriobacteriaceae bacterium]
MALRTSLGPRRRPSAFATDIRRTIAGNLRRFISLFVITALGATMLVGLKAACDDLRTTADAFYDGRRLFDVSVKSTLGLTASDIDALFALNGVEEAEGGYTEAAYTEVAGKSEKVDLRALANGNLNEPLLIEGRLPRRAGELAVTTRYLRASGHAVGDTVAFSSTARAGEADPGGDEAEGTAVFTRGAYTITGVVRDPMDVNPDADLMAFRTSSTTKYVFYLPMDAVEDPGVFTVAYLAVAGARELESYSPAYEDLIAALKDGAEGIRAAREQVRTEAVKAEAMRTIDDEEASATAQLADAAAKLADGQAQLDASAAKLADGRRELTLSEAMARREIARGRETIDDGLAQIKAGEAEVRSQEALLPGAREALAAGRAELDAREAAALDAALAKVEEGIAPARAKLEAKDAELTASIAQLDATRGQLAAGFAAAGVSWPEDEWAALEAVDTKDAAATAVAAFSDALAAAADGARPALEARRGQLAAAVAQMTAQLEALDGQIAALDPSDPANAETIASLTAQRDALASQVAAAKEGVSGIDAVLSGALASNAAELAQGRAAAAVGAAELTAGRDELASRESAARAEARRQVEAALATHRAELDARATELEAAPARIAQARAELEQNRIRLAAGLRALNAQEGTARSELAAARDALEEGAAELAAGQAELDANRKTYEDERADAAAKIADARGKVDEIGPATWYIQDRTSLPSYGSVEADAQSIEAIATVFPIIFFIVAILISLTTATRMVEEDRGLIGLYKALGYRRSRIMAKYLAYSFTACLAGGIVGDILGFVALPEVIFVIFRTMYALTDYQLQFNPVSALLGIGLFATGITGATFLACRHALAEVPASLMRPRAPRVGGRILLERIGPLWRRLGFLNKVAVRNLFRYKKRALMTIFGIAGCCALMICGLGIRDTVVSLKGRQYGDDGIARYDLMAVTADADFAEARELLEGAPEVADLMQARIDTVTASFDGARESVQIVVVPDGTDLADHVRLVDTSGSPLELPEDGNAALITKNAEQVLGFSVGDEVDLQDSTLSEGRVRVAGIAVSYLGNFVYMSESAYERAFGAPAVRNAFLAHLEGGEEAQVAFADELGDDGLFVSITSTAKIASSFSESFKIIDVVVYIVTVMAATLAFAVVFTLSTTNISERERELATIKVLGFRRREVQRYINKETVILALIGVVAGCPLGYGITRLLAVVLRMPSLFFDTVVDPITYVIAGAASIVFVLAVNKITNRSLDRIVMVEALKSAE